MDRSTDGAPCGNSARIAALRQLDRAAVPISLPAPEVVARQSRIAAALALALALAGIASLGLALS
jgi:hypothetical protein